MGRLEAVLAGLEETQKAGMKFPITSYLLYQPELPGTYQELLGYLKAEED
jgi:hypothetical protein